MLAVSLVARSPPVLATYQLVERQVDVRTMMSIGGWSDCSAIEPYLAEPSQYQWFP
ncbi:hypothetical protein SAMN05421752_1245 [Natronorubrum thiooxidans]|uniref:Uncharacterized protein n=1 Tax=Natronorubrum thiooxidans TaxID=308853 RepID=A0A1N7H4D2_9EURY|nr:hypothetical protein SAMN05421752_1245 [Natronorubrum thiooxidans]